ncbi:MAG: FAD-dependent oxidoreductase [Nanoarchaeota archaeon]|nr:FAD-dependent oxidoreductase [Nanoarchaeota archaeon]
MNIVIIGLGTAAFAALLAIRKIDRNAKITIIDKKPFDLLHSCGLPYALEGKIKLEELEHSISADKMNIKLLSESEAVKIDRKNNEIEYVTLKDNSSSKISFDKLLLDFGSVPFLPPVEGLKDNENVFVIKNSSDIREISSQIKKSKTAAVIGAGAIGLETAFALMKKGLKVTVIEALSCLFPRAIDPDISANLESYLKEEGIDILLNKKIKKINGKNILLDEKTIKADIIICATGVRPNIKLAFESGLKTSEFGIIVDKYMQTSAKEIYAAGDCIEAANLITKKKFESQLATTAYKQGTIAGENIAGKKSGYKGSISTFASVVGETEIACTGLNSYYAKQAGFDVVIGKSISTDKPEWFGDNEKIILKILADKKTQKIIGAQAIGRNAAGRINVISTAIAAGMTLKDLSNVELGYCPALSQAYDILHQAVDLALRRIR